MSFKKAIQFGKEWRKPYYGRVANRPKRCRNHGACDRCLGDRTHAARVREFAAASEIREWEIGQADTDYELNLQFLEARETLLQRFVRESEDDVADFDWHHRDYLGDCWDEDRDRWDDIEIDPWDFYREEDRDRISFTKEQWLAGYPCEDQWWYDDRDDSPESKDWWGDEEAPSALNGYVWWSVDVTFRWKDKHYPRFLSYEVCAKDEAEALRLARFEARRDGHLQQGRSNIRMKAWLL